jgi:HEAT repeat protein
MSINKLLKQLTLATFLAAATVMAQTPYDEGQRALREQRWMDAAGQFEQAIAADSEQADAAMYWRAHSLYKAGRRNEAQRQIRRLERKYPQSQWVKEAQLLQIEYGDSAGTVDQGTSDPSGLDEELRMYALAQLMDRDPERALPLVLDLVRNSESENVRREALFVLGMSEEPAAQQAIADIAGDSNDPELQVEAIQLLGMASTESSQALLAALYSDSSNDEVKMAVIQAHIINDEPAPLLAILESEQNQELQREIIHALGAMDATSELQALYPTLQDRETKVAAIEAFSIAGDSAMLRQVLSTETDPELRRACIYGIAMEDGEESAEFIESIYGSAASKAEKSTILEALSMMEDAKDLALKIVRTETDPELQREAIQVLGIMEATEELGDLYGSLTDPDSRKAVLESMAIADDTDGLFKVLQTEQDEELRAAAIQALAITDDEAAADYFVTLESDEYLFELLEDKG